MFILMLMVFVFILTTIVARKAHENVNENKQKKHE